MKKQFVFKVEIEGSLEDLEEIENRLNIVATIREIRLAKVDFHVDFSIAGSKAIELTERKQGIHPISPSVDYRNYPNETTE